MVFFLAHRSLFFLAGLQQRGQRRHLYLAPSLSMEHLHRWMLCFVIGGEV